MTGADDAHGNVLLRPYIVCARQEMCLCSFDVSHLCHRWFDVMIVCWYIDCKCIQEHAGH